MAIDWLLDEFVQKSPHHARYCNFEDHLQTPLSRRIGLWIDFTDAGHDLHITAHGLVEQVHNGGRRLNASR